MKRFIPRYLLEKAASKSLERISMLEKDEIALKPYFYNDICKLEKLINKDLSSWK